LVSVNMWWHLIAWIFGFSPCIAACYDGCWTFQWFHWVLWAMISVIIYYYPCMIPDAEPQSAEACHKWLLFCSHYLQFWMTACVARNLICSFFLLFCSSHMSALLAGYSLLCFPFWRSQSWRRNWASSKGPQENIIFFPQYLSLRDGYIHNESTINS
jgi:hypothetical protein